MYIYTYSKDGKEMEINHSVQAIGMGIVSFYTARGFDIVRISINGVVLFEK